MTAGRGRPVLCKRKGCKNEATRFYANAPEDGARCGEHPIRGAARTTREEWIVARGRMREKRVRETKALGMIKFQCFAGSRADDVCRHCFGGDREAMLKYALATLADPEFAKGHS